MLIFHPSFDHDFVWIPCSVCNTFDHNWLIGYFRHFANKFAQLKFSFYCQSQTDCLYYNCMYIVWNILWSVLLTYDCCQQEVGLTACHQCQSRILGICWKDKIIKEDISRHTGQEVLETVIRRRKSLLVWTHTKVGIRTSCLSSTEVDPTRVPEETWR